MQRPIVSCKEILVKSDSTSKLAIVKLKSYSKSSSANKNKSLIVYSLKVVGVSNSTKTLIVYM